MIDIVYNRSRLYIFNTVENITFSPISKYWDRNDNMLLTDYFKSVSDQLFEDRGKVHHDFKIYFKNYTNISKIHIYLYPLTIAEKYYGSNQIETIKEAIKIKDLLPKTIRRNSMFIIDKFNNKIASVMKKYDKKRIRVVYHLNDQNFFEGNKNKEDSIYVYEIRKPDPIIKRKM